MRNKDKTREELIAELAEMRQQVAELEAMDTERKRAEEALRESEERYRSLTDDVLDSSAVGLFILDSDFRIVWINQSTERFFGLRREEVIGKNKRQLIRERIKHVFENPERFSEKVFATYDNNTYIENFECYVLPDAEREGRWLEHWSQPIRSGLYAGGRIEHYTDITERVQAEEELRESEELHRMLTDTLPDAVAMFDLQGQFIYASPLAPELFGVESVEDLIGTSGLRFIAPEEKELALKNLAAAADEEIQRGEEYSVVRGDGTRFSAELNVSTLRDIDGKAKAFIIVIRDITKRKWAEEELQRSYGQLQRTLEGTISVLVSTIEIKDPYTAGHQRRVAQLAGAIANEMGLPEEQIEGLRLAALIHDMGKITVPTEILNRPGELNNFHWGLIRAHPQVGYDVLKDMDFPWPLADIVLQHHERLDGSGYPQGLSDGEIMVEARILAVADVVEAMSSHRPYRPARGIDQALEEISQNSGRLYDAEAVDACLKLFTEKGFEFEILK